MVHAPDCGIGDGRGAGATRAGDAENNARGASPAGRGPAETGSREVAPMIVLSATDIRALVDEAALIPAIDAVMRRVSEGRGQLPLRSAIPVGGGNRFGVM